MTTTTADLETKAAQLSDSTSLAVDRTRLAFERTTMAWVRTATSLISFGFSIYKFFQLQSHAEVAGRIIGPREFAMAMISIGILSLIFATLTNWHSMRALRVHYRGASVPRSLAVILAALMSILGIVALIAVFTRR